MEIVWDERKRSVNLIKHGLDFADFQERFDLDGCLIRPTTASRTGRVRLKLIGLLDGAIVAAVVSPLGAQALSIVSLRRAGRAERRLYDQDQES